jgi:hypothetical protein
LKNPAKTENIKNPAKTENIKNPAKIEIQKLFLRSYAARAKPHPCFIKTQAVKIFL